MTDDPPLVGPGGKAIAMNLLSPIGSGLDTLLKRALYLALHVRGVTAYVGPLLELSFVQFARWVVIPKGRFPRLSEEQPHEELSHDYLLFNSNYNGQWDQYLDAFSAVYDWGVDSMWEGSMHWVPARHVQGLKKFVTWSQIRRGNVPADYYFCAYPEAALTDIRAALELRDTLHAFASQTPLNEDPASFVGRWRELLYAVQHCLASTGPAPVDGDLLASLDPDAGNLSLGYPEEPPDQFEHQGEKLGKTPFLFDLQSPGSCSRENQCGQAYGLTMLSPILPGRDHVDAIRAAIAALPVGAESPFHRTAATHTARWVIVDGLPGQDEGTSEDILKSRYLLFDANFDTDDDGLDGYLRAFSRELAGEIRAIYSHCVAFDGSASAFPTYARRCQIPTTFYFSDYAQTQRGKAPNVIRALALQRDFIRLVIRLQEIERPLPPGAPAKDRAAAMQSAFAAFMTENQP
jgi:hypothetical protein